MNAQQKSSISTSIATTGAVSFVGRVLQHDATRKGFGAAIAGVLVAVVSEAIWPSEA